MTVNRNIVISKVKILIVLISLGLTLILAYVLGGCVFAYFPDVMHGAVFAIMLFAVALILVVLCVYILINRYDLCVKLESAMTLFRFADLRKGFTDRYNICPADICVLSVVLLVGTFVRVIGYDWGGVASWQPDERKLTDAPITLINSHLPYLENVYYPNQFISKITALITYIVKRASGITYVDGSSSVWVIFLFRIVVALCGVVTIYVSFLIGNYFERHLGCVFAIVVAIYPHFVSLSKQVTGDVTTLMFLSILMLYALRYMEQRRPLFLVLMCGCAACATLEKWHGAVGIGFIGILLLFNCDGVRDYISKGFKTIGVYLLWMILFAPNIMANPFKTLKNGFYNIAVYDGSAGLPYTKLLSGYLGFVYEYIFGLSGIVFFVIGIIYIATHLERKWLILLVGPLKILCLCFLNREFRRWGLELYYADLFVIAVGIYLTVFESSRMVKNVIASGLIRILAGFCFIIMLLSMSSATYLSVLVADSNDQDSRLVQRRDCKEAGISPYNTISQYYTGFTPASGCDSEYPDAVILPYLDWSDYLTTDDGVLRTSAEYEYACFGPKHYPDDMEIINALEENGCEKLYEYSVVCSDLCSNPFIHGRSTVNDYDIIMGNVAVIRQIYSGALFGEDIVVYNIGNLPVNNVTSDET